MQSLWPKCLLRVHTSSSPPPQHGRATQPFLISPCSRDSGVAGFVYF